MTVYDVYKYRMGNTTIQTVGTWPVFIKAVDEERQTVTASWNGNPVRTFYWSEWSKWRLNKPELVTGLFGSQKIAKKSLSAGIAPPRAKKHRRIF